MHSYILCVLVVVFYVNGDAQYIQAQLKQGDVVGMALDQDRKYVQFFRNGEIIRQIGTLLSLLHACIDVGA